MIWHDALVGAQTCPEPEREGGCEGARERKLAVSLSQPMPAPRRSLGDVHHIHSRLIHHRPHQAMTQHIAKLEIQGAYQIDLADLDL